MACMPSPERILPRDSIEAYALDRHDEERGSLQQTYFGLSTMLCQDGSLGQKVGD